MNDAREDAKRFAAFVRAMPADERARLQTEEYDSSLAMHAEFQVNFEKGRCLLCKQALDSFDERSPCLHWLMRPPGVRKTHIEVMLKTKGLFQMESYLRWLANEDAKGRNINDLAEEGSGKVLEKTFRYRDLEWAVSVAQGDLEGHKNSTVAYGPHYHFQMRIGGRPFINFNDFHLPLAHSDVLMIETMRQNPDIRARFPGGEGMADLLNEKTLDAVVELSVGERDEHTATLNMSTMLMADEGATMSGDDIYNLIQKAQAEGRTFASVAKEMPNTRALTVVSPGAGVVEMAERSGGRGKR